MRSLKTFTVICIASLCLGNKCDPDYSPPEVERCVVLTDTCFCIDKRLPAGQQEYEKPLIYCRGYQATSPQDYAILEDHYDYIVRELKECQDRL